MSQLSRLILYSIRGRDERIHLLDADTVVTCGNQDTKGRTMHLSPYQFRAGTFGAACPACLAILDDGLKPAPGDPP